MGRGKMLFWTVVAILIFSIVATFYSMTIARVFNIQFKYKIAICSDVCFTNNLKEEFILNGKKY